MVASSGHCCGSETTFGVNSRSRRSRRSGRASSVRPRLLANLADMIVLRAGRHVYRNDACFSIGRRGVSESSEAGEVIETCALVLSLAHGQKETVMSALQAMAIAIAVS